VLLSRNVEHLGKSLSYETLEKVLFKKEVFPGDQLRLEMELIKIKENIAFMRGQALVDGKVMCEAQFTFRLLQKPSRPHIHPTATVHPSAVLGKDVSIGPFSIIGEHVFIGDRTIIEAHVMVERWTRIGENCQIYFGCVLGSPAQDIKYNGEKTWVVIGDRNEIREYVTINRSTGSGTVTEVGSDNLFLTHVHIGHNCKIGNKVVIANSTNLGGHTEVEDCVTIGGMTGIHQFSRVGKGSMVGAYTRLPQDVLPYTLCEGNPAEIKGLNIIGLRRYGASRAAIQELKDLFRIIYRSEKNTTQALEEIQLLSLSEEESRHFFAFLKGDSKRGILKKKTLESEERVFSMEA